MSSPKRTRGLQRFGHDDGDRTRALFEALEHGSDWWRHVEFAFNHESHNRWWAGLSHPNRARWLLGQLWNCRDILGSMYHAEITDRDPWGEGNHIFTVGALARLLAKELDKMADLSAIPTGTTCLGAVPLGATFVFSTAEILGTQCIDSIRPPYEGDALTVVGFRPRNKNNIVVRDSKGRESLMPQDMVEKALALKSSRRVT